MPLIRTDVGELVNISAATIRRIKVEAKKRSGPDRVLLTIWLVNDPNPLRFARRATIANAVLNRLGWEVFRDADGNPDVRQQTP